MSLGREQRRDLPRTDRCATVVARFKGRQHVCVLENVSPRGACLAFNPDLPLPASFDLELSPGELAPVTQVWRRGNLLGVRFVAAPRREGLVGRARDWLEDRLAGRNRERAPR